MLQIVVFIIHHFTFPLLNKGCKVCRKAGEYAQGEQKIFKLPSRFLYILKKIIITR